MRVCVIYYARNHVSCLCLEIIKRQNVPTTCSYTSNIGTAGRVFQLWDLIRGDRHPGKPPETNQLHNWKSIQPLVCAGQELICLCNIRMALRDQNRCRGFCEATHTHNLHVWIHAWPHDHMCGSHRWTITEARRWRANNLNMKWVGLIGIFQAETVLLN